MQGDLDRFAAVLELHLADEQQELGQLKGSGSQRLNLFQRVRLVLEQVGIVFAQHPGARARRHHHRIIPGKQRQLRARHGPGLFGVTRGVGRLSAAALPLRVLHSNAFALEQVNRIHPGLGIKQVDHTGAEQVDPLRFYAGVLARFWQWRGDTGRVRHSVVKKLAHQACLSAGYPSAEVADCKARSFQQPCRPGCESQTPGSRPGVGFFRVTCSA
ncbi:hypothetical protein D3C84_771290 [compost metagenome]